MAINDLFAIGTIAFAFIGAVYHIKEVKKLELQLLESRKLSAELKQKLSANNNPILQLSELVHRGVLLDVTVIDRNDVYLHNGAQYR